MARSFASASSQYLWYDGVIRGVTPLTVCVWAYPLQTDASCNLFAVSDHDVATGRLQVYLNASAKAGIGIQNDSGSASQFTSTVNSYSANQWCHVAAVFASNTSRTIYLDGDTANKATGTTNVIPDPTLSRTTVGTMILSNTPEGYHNGYLAHIGVWNVALTDADVVRLYNNGIGADPRSVRPDALVAYWPLINNDGDQDYWGNFHLTASGSPTYAQHPPVLMRSRPKYVILGAAGGAPTISSVTITGTRTVSNTLTANVVTVPGTVDSIAYQWEIADDGSGTNAADLSGETAATLALTYADFASRLDANGEAYVRVGAIATVGVESSAESFSDWVRVTAGGSGVVRPIGQSVYISV